MTQRIHRFLLCCAALAALACSHAQAQQAPEATVKAALIYKFASYVEWPPESFASPDAPLVIGLVAADEVAAELETLVRGRTINSRPVAIRRVKEGDALPGIHVLVVGRAASSRLSGLARNARQYSILVISDAEGGLESGSIINFVPVEDRLGFEVSVDAAEQSRLRISSRMLAVARRVVARSS